MGSLCSGNTSMGKSFLYFPSLAFEMECPFWMVCRRSFSGIYVCPHRIRYHQHYSRTFDRQRKVKITHDWEYFSRGMLNLPYTFLNKSMAVLHSMDFNRNGIVGVSLRTMLFVPNKDIPGKSKTTNNHGDPFRWIRQYDLLSYIGLLIQDFQLGGQHIPLCSGVIFDNRTPILVRNLHQKSPRC